MVLFAGVRWEGGGLTYTTTAEGDVCTRASVGTKPTVSSLQGE